MGPWSFSGGVRVIASRKVVKQSLVGSTISLMTGEVMPERLRMAKSRMCRATKKTARGCGTPYWVTSVATVRFGRKVPLGFREAVFHERSRTSAISNMCLSRMGRVGSGADFQA